MINDNHYQFYSQRVRCETERAPFVGGQGDVLDYNTIWQSGLLKGHSVQVSGIVAGQTYGFVVVAFAPGGETESQPHYFTLPSSSN